MVGLPSFGSATDCSDAKLNSVGAWLLSPQPSWMPTPDAAPDSVESIAITPLAASITEVVGANLTPTLLFSAVETVACPVL
ncbi:hypothetical protein D3C81_2262100 [compost metagenome]